MSKGTFIVAMIISVALHAWLMMIPPRPMQLPPPAMIVPVVETELAEPEPEPSIVEPAPDPEPIAEEPPPAPEPEPPVEAPLPNLEQVAEAEPVQEPDQGDFAGATRIAGPPELRINWGTGDQALDTIAAGNMILVVLEREGDRAVIGQQIVYEEGNWRRRVYRPAGSTRYSNRLRIVDQVPAFDAARLAVNLRGEERLAVLLPLRVERKLESAQLEAAYGRGLAMNQIDNFAGRFTLRDGDLAFDITHIGASERNAAQ